MSHTITPVRRLLTLLLLMSTPASAVPLLIEAPPSVSMYQREIEKIPPGSMAPLLELTGTTEPQPPIRIVIAPEHSEIAASAPPWVSGWAFGTLGLIVLVPSRASRYPDDGVEELLRHEVTHVLAARAAGGTEIPRWFDEGLAMFASRGWQIEDRSRLVFELMRGDEVPIRTLDSLFAGGEGGSARAYAISGAFVRDVVLHHGRTVPGQILARLRRGDSFDAAFSNATGLSFADAELQFWRRQTLWNRWLPFLTSSFLLWLFITLLAIWAMTARKARDRARARRWELEEARLLLDGSEDEVVN